MSDIKEHLESRLEEVESELEELNDEIMELRDKITNLKYERGRIADRLDDIVDKENEDQH